MEQLKNPSQRNAYNSLRKAFRRFEDVKLEFTKIQWSEERGVQEYAKVVVLATFMSGMVLYFADVFVHKFVGGVNALLRLIFG